MNDPASPSTCPRCGHALRLITAYGGRRKVLAIHRSNRATGPNECVACIECSERRKKEREA